MVLLDIGANPDSTPENLVQYARMGAIFAERVLGVAEPRVALLSIGEEKGKGDARIQRATELLDATDLHFEGNVEGKDLTTHMADVVVCDAVLGNVVIKFFEGLSTFIFDLWRAEFSGSLRGRLAYLLMRPGVGADPRHLRLREGRRVATARRARHGDHHPRPGQAPDDRVRRARSRRETARTGVPALIAESLAAPGGRRGARSARAAARRGTAEPAPRREPLRGGLDERPGADRRPRRHRRTGSARRVRGAGRPERRAGRSGLAAADRRTRRSRSRSATSASPSGCGSWLVPARRSCRSRPPSARRSAATVERVLGLELETVTVLVDGVGG